MKFFAYYLEFHSVSECALCAIVRHADCRQKAVFNTKAVGYIIDVKPHRLGRSVVYLRAFWVGKKPTRGICPFFCGWCAVVGRNLCHARCESLASCVCKGDQLLIG